MLLLNSIVPAPLRRNIKRFHDGVACTGESCKQVVELSFFREASIKDSQRLFNSSLAGDLRRAIDLREGEKIDEARPRRGGG